MSAQAQSSAPDSSLVRVGRIIVRRASHVDSAWPGFWPPTKGFVVTRPGVGVLLGSPMPPPPSYGYSALPYNGRLPAGLYYHVGDLDDLDLSNFPYTIDYVVGGDTVIAVALRSTDVETLKLLYHEDFHGFQRGRFAFPEVREMSASWDAIANEQFRESAEREREMLATALEVEEAEALRGQLRKYVDARAIRYDATPPDIVAIERMLELKEGSAELVGVSAAAAALSLHSTFVQDEIRDRLTTELPTAAIGPREYWQTRFRIYGTGAALGLLMDRLQLPWRGAAERGESLDEILTEALRSATRE